MVESKVLQPILCQSVVCKWLRKLLGMVLAMMMVTYWWWQNGSGYVVVVFIIHMADDDNGGIITTMTVHGVISYEFGLDVST